ncbi:hypothetical protein OF83DRAFT_591572 [Amylostereum chailletii]|nr:hypothetical protein OF83DRAFT_591572 [Amylostereum chailletii]
MKASEETKKGALKPAPMKLPARKPLLIRAKTGSGAPSSFKPSSRSKLASTDAVVEVAAAVPLPPSPHSTPEPSLVALPPSPVETPQDIDEIPTSEQKNDGHSDALDPTPPELVVSASVATPVKDDATSATSAFQDVGKTPISALVSSIQRGFLFTPNSPLSPPQSYAVPAPGEGGPWTFTAWPRGMGAFGQMLPAIQDEPSFEGVIDSSSPKRSADESGDFCRPALVLACFWSQTIALRHRLSASAAESEHKRFSACGCKYKQFREPLLLATGGTVRTATVAALPEM